jgi:uncharacterized membrane protein
MQFLTIYHTFFFNVNFSDPRLSIAKLLVYLFSVIAGVVIVYVSGYNLYLSFKKKDESKEG